MNPSIPTGISALNKNPKTLAEVDAAGGDTYSAALAAQNKPVAPAPALQIPVPQAVTPSTVSDIPLAAARTTLTGIAMLARSAQRFGEGVQNTVSNTAQSVVANSTPVTFDRSPQAVGKLQVQGNVIIPQASRLAFVNNNPGNLRFAGQAGAVQGDSGFAKFSTPEIGYIALQNQIKLDQSRGLTLGQFISKYAPPTENNTSQYLSQAASSLGVQANAFLNNIPTTKLAQFIARKESGTQIA